MRTFFAFLILFLALFTGPSGASAARLYAVTGNSGGPTSTIAIYLDTEGASLNALEGRILSSGIRILGIEEGGSVVSLWLEKPSEEAGAIRFSGLIPGGYSGSEGELFRLRAEGAAGEFTADLSLFANDGEGSALLLSERTFSPASGLGEEDPDRTPPEPFLVERVSDPALFDGAHALVFQAIDKGSGIGHYEILEVPAGRDERFEGWIKGESPYLLRDQDLRSRVYVRAVDRRGNFTIVQALEGTPATPWAYIIPLLVLVCLIVIWRLRKK